MGALGAPPPNGRGPIICYASNAKFLLFVSLHSLAIHFKRNVKWNMVETYLQRSYISTLNTFNHFLAHFNNVFVMTRSAIEPTTFCSRVERSNHLPTAAVCYVVSALYGIFKPLSKRLYIVNFQKRYRREKHRKRLYWLINVIIDCVLKKTQTITNISGYKM